MNKKALSGVVRFFFGMKQPSVVRRTVRITKPTQAQREEARALVHARLAYFNQFYQFSYNKVFIKNTKTRWGSCSSNRNLNFNYRIITLTPKLQDYLIVHELCHLQEFNHGHAFWELVGKQIPDYEILRTTLRALR